MSLSGNACSFLQPVMNQADIERGSNMAANNIDEYIATCPPEVQGILQQVRTVIREVAPQAVEAIRYGMPTFILYGNLVHFAAFKRHIGFYPTPAGIEPFKAELAAYPTSKGAIQFPLNRPVPFDLIRRIVQARVLENQEKAQRKGGKTTQ